MEQTSFRLCGSCGGLVTVKTCQWSDPHCQDDCRLSEYVFAKIAIEDMGSYEYPSQALSTKNWKNWLGLLSRNFGLHI